MQAFEMTALAAQRAAGGKAWLEFLRVPALSAGVYHLAAGQDDPQRPHTEDEVYYVVAGRGRFRCGDTVCDVAAGTVLFVERLAEHRFCDITEELTVLVVFAPAEGLLAEPPASLP